MAMHFTKRINLVLDPESKAKTFIVSPKSTKDKIEVFAGFHNNNVRIYKAKIKKGSDKDQYEKGNFGEIEAH